ncbi:hypothetical protein V2I01_00485 [Micromonospora sp. BRA006-A]|nr:hypothetical protein [Micromonospora sp. BRA006-A]
MYEGRWLHPQALMLRESLQRWVGTAVTGDRRGHADAPGRGLSILDTTGPAFSYHPDKLSMERTQDSAFGPADRIASSPCATSTSPTPGQAGAAVGIGTASARAAADRRRRPGGLDRADRQAAEGRRGGHRLRAAHRRGRGARPGRDGVRRRPIAVARSVCPPAGPRLLRGPAGGVAFGNGGDAG